VCLRERSTAARPPSLRPRGENRLNHLIEKRIVVPAFARVRTDALLALSGRLILSFGDFLLKFAVLNRHLRGAEWLPVLGDQLAV